MQSQISKMEKNQSLLIHRDDFRGRCSVSEFNSLMPSQLSWSDQKSIFHLIIFCSQDHPVLFNNNEGIRAIEEKIKSALEGLDIFHFPTLVQLWMSKTIGSQQLLVTSDLPFGISLLSKGLCLYRNLCLGFKYALDCEEELGPVGRVFRNGVPEFSPYVSCYSAREFKLRDAAVSCGVNGYMALPIFESGGNQCVCVLELITVWDGNYYLTDAIAKIIDAFKAAGLGMYDPRSPLHKEIISQHEFALVEIENGLKAVCHAHCIPFAQTWFTSIVENHNESIMCTREKGSVMLVKKVSSFRKDCIQFGLKKGQGVVGSAFTSGTSCFCKDVQQLSIDEYPLVLSARKVGLTGSFAIFLQSRSTETEIYVLEFFLHSSQTLYRKPHTLLNSLFTTVQQHLQSFKVASVQEPGADIPLNIIKPDRLGELGSLEMGVTTQSQSKGKHVHHGRNFYPRTQDNFVVLLNEEGMTKAPELNDLRNQSTRQLKDAECAFDVSIHEEKQLCREHSIDRPPSKRKADRSLSQKDVRGMVNNNGKTCNRDQARSGLPPDEDTTYVSHPAAPAPENEGTIMIKASFKEDMIKFPLSVSSGIMDFENEVTKRLKLTAGSFEIKYQKEDYNCISVASDADLQKLVSDTMSQSKNTVKVLLEPVLNQHLESSRNSVACPSPQTVPTQKESTVTILTMYEDETVNFQLSLPPKFQELKDQLTKRLKLRADNFQIKCLDDAKKWIPVASDIELNTCITILKSQEEPMIRLAVEPDTNQLPEQVAATVSPTMPQAMIKHNDGLLTIKATYKEDMIKFQLSSSSGMMQLKDAVNKRLNLSAESYKVKFQDVNNSWIYLSRDEDLQNHLRAMRSSDRFTVRLHIEPLKN